MKKKLLTLLLAAFSLNCHGVRETEKDLFTKDDCQSEGIKGMNEAYNRCKMDPDTRAKYMNISSLVKNYREFCQEKNVRRLTINTVDELIESRKNLNAQELLQVPDVNELSFIFQVLNAKPEQNDKIPTKEILHAHHLLAITRISKYYQSNAENPLEKGTETSFEENKNQLCHFIKIATIEEIGEETFKNTMDSYTYYCSNLSNLRLKPEPEPEPKPEPKPEPEPEPKPEPEPEPEPEPKPEPEPEPKPESRVDENRVLNSREAMLNELKNVLKKRKQKKQGEKTETTI